MGCIGILLLLGIASLIAASYGQCIRVRSGNSQPACVQPPSCCSSCSPCGSSVEDLTTLLAIVRALEEKEAPKSSISNAEEIILQLVNALVYATTHNSGCNNGGAVSIPSVGGVINGNKGGSGGTDGAAGNGNTGGGGSNTAGTGSPSTQKDGSLLSLDLLQPGSQSNPDYDFLKLSIADKNIFDLGLG